jgi:hypothetical protein
MLQYALSCPQLFEHAVFRLAVLSALSLALHSVQHLLCVLLVLQVLRGGLLYSQSFSRGAPTSSLSQQPAPPGAFVSGTKVGSAAAAAVELQ